MEYRTALESVTRDKVGNAFKSVQFITVQCLCITVMQILANQQLSTSLNASVRFLISVYLIFLFLLTDQFISQFFAITSLCYVRQ